ncbi:hypothetical protein [Arenimonas sp. MALMAid1274]|uniref:hypothetical protein n=1 Tax=Arenimonas sp. MALMAid1274 TaxID=3411630 RepID=UPI003B9F89BC
MARGYAFILGLAVAAAGLPGPSPAQAPAAAGSAEVRCQLPPQIRRLGRNTTYLAAGRIVQTSPEDCRVRGGQAKGGAVAAAPAAATPADGTMAVMIGGEAGKPACPVSGEIIGLKAGSTLSVRAGPSTAHPRLDRLGNGRRVFVCDGSADEAWLGVVYADRGQDCGVAKPRAQASAYAGPCRVGWVNAGWVRTE